MSAARPTIHAVLFDADGVIQRPSADWRGALEALCHDGARAAEFIADVLAAEKRCLAGGVDLVASLAPVLDRWGCAAPLEDVLGVLYRIDRDEEALAVIAELRRRGTTVALATNQHAYRASFMTERLGYASRFDHLFYSCELGHAKPSREFFVEAVRRLARPAGDVLFLDDHADNVVAAREVGLHAEVAVIDAGAATLKSILATYGLRAA